MNVLGRIESQSMIPNRFGEIVSRCWQTIPDHFNQVQLDEFVVMPNHIHGILIIINNSDKMAVSPNNSLESFGNPSSFSLATVIRSFKSSATREANLLRSTSKRAFWQRNYYEHIIRNEQDLSAIREYIRFNPLKWHDDPYHQLDNGM